MFLSSKMFDYSQMFTMNELLIVFWNTCNINVKHYKERSYERHLLFHGKLNDDNSSIIRTRIEIFS